MNLKTFDIDRVVNRMCSDLKFKYESFDYEKDLNTIPNLDPIKSLLKELRHDVYLTEIVEKEIGNGYHSGRQPLVSSLTPDYISTEKKLIVDFTVDQSLVDSKERKYLPLAKQYSNFDGHAYTVIIFTLENYRFSRETKQIAQVVDECLNFIQQMCTSHDQELKQTLTDQLTSEDIDEICKVNNLNLAEVMPNFPDLGDKRSIKYLHQVQRLLINSAKTKKPDYKKVKKEDVARALSDLKASYSTGKIRLPNKKIFQFHCNLNLKRKKEKEISMSQGMKSVLRSLHSKLELGQCFSGDKVKLVGFNYKTMLESKFGFVVEKKGSRNIEGRLNSETVSPITSNFSDFVTFSEFLSRETDDCEVLRPREILEMLMPENEVHKELLRKMETTKKVYNADKWNFFISKVSSSMLLSSSGSIEKNEVVVNNCGFEDLLLITFPGPDFSRSTKNRVFMLIQKASDSILDMGKNPLVVGTEDGNYIVNVFSSNANQCNVRYENVLTLASQRVYAFNEFLGENYKDEDRVYWVGIRSIIAQENDLILADTMGNERYLAIGLTSMRSQVDKFISEKGSLVCWNRTRAWVMKMFIDSLSRWIDRFGKVSFEKRPRLFGIGNCASSEESISLMYTSYIVDDRRMHRLTSMYDAMGKLIEQDQLYRDQKDKEDETLMKGYTSSEFNVKDEVRLFKKIISGEFAFTRPRWFCFLMSRLKRNEIDKKPTHHNLNFSSIYESLHNFASSKSSFVGRNKTNSKLAMLVTKFLKLDSTLKTSKKIKMSGLDKFHIECGRFRYYVKDVSVDDSKINLVCKAELVKKAVDPMDKDPMLDISDDPNLKEAILTNIERSEYSIKIRELKMERSFNISLKSSNKVSINLLKTITEMRALNLDLNLASSCVYFLKKGWTPRISLCAKNQPNGNRDISIMDIITRLMLRLVECTSEKTVSLFEEDLSMDKEKFKTHSSMVRMAQNVTYEGEAITSFWNLDKTRWGPGLMPFHFADTTRGLLSGLIPESHLLMVSIILYMFHRKEMHLPDAIIFDWISHPKEVVKRKAENSDKLWSQLRKETLDEGLYYFHNYPGMCQGLLQLSSGIEHDMKIFTEYWLIGKLVEKRDMNEPILHKNGTTSDDSIKVLVCRDEKDLDLHININTLCNYCWNMKDNTKKSSIHRNLSELNQNYINRGVETGVGFKFIMRYFETLPSTDYVDAMNHVLGSISMMSMRDCSLLTTTFVVGIYLDFMMKKFFGDYKSNRYVRVEEDGFEEVVDRCETPLNLGGYFVFIPSVFSLVGPMYDLSYKSKYGSEMGRNIVSTLLNLGSDEISDESEASLFLPTVRTISNQGNMINTVRHSILRDHSKVVSATKLTLLSGKVEQLEEYKKSYTEGVMEVLKSKFEELKKSETLSGLDISFMSLEKDADRVYKQIKSAREERESLSKKLKGQRATESYTNEEKKVLYFLKQQSRLKRVLTVDNDPIFKVFSFFKTFHNSREYLKAILSRDFRGLEEVLIISKYFRRNSYKMFNKRNATSIFMKFCSIGRSQYTFSINPNLVDDLFCSSMNLISTETMGFINVTSQSIDLVYKLSTNIEKFNTSFWEAPQSVNHDLYLSLISESLRVKSITEDTSLSALKKNKMSFYHMIRNPFNTLRLDFNTKDLLAAKWFGRLKEKTIEEVDLMFERLKLKHEYLKDTMEETLDNVSISRMENFSLKIQNLLDVASIKKISIYNSHPTGKHETTQNQVVSILLNWITKNLFKGTHYSLSQESVSYGEGVKDVSECSHAFSCCMMLITPEERQKFVQEFREDNKDAITSGMLLVSQKNYNALNPLNNNIAIMLSFCSGQADYIESIVDRSLRSASGHYLKEQKYVLNDQKRRQYDMGSPFSYLCYYNKNLYLFEFNGEIFNFISKTFSNFASYERTISNLLLSSVFSNEMRNYLRDKYSWKMTDTDMNDDRLFWNELNSSRKVIYTTESHNKSLLSSVYVESVLDYKNCSLIKKIHYNSKALTQKSTLTIKPSLRFSRFYIPKTPYQTTYGVPLNYILEQGGLRLEDAVFNSGNCMDVMYSKEFDDLTDLYSSVPKMNFLPILRSIRQKDYEVKKKKEPVYVSTRKVGNWADVEENDLKDKVFNLLVSSLVRDSVSIDLTVFLCDSISSNMSFLMMNEKLPLFKSLNPPSQSLGLELLEFTSNLKESSAYAIVSACFQREYMGTHESSKRAIAELEHSTLEFMNILENQEFRSELSRIFFEDQISHLNFEEINMIREKSSREIYTTNYERFISEIFSFQSESIDVHYTKQSVQELIDELRQTLNAVHCFKKMKNNKSAYEKYIAVMTPEENQFVLTYSNHLRSLIKVFGSKTVLISDGERDDVPNFMRGDMSSISRIRKSVSRSSLLDSLM